MNPYNQSKSSRLILFLAFVLLFSCKQKAPISELETVISPKPCNQKSNFDFKVIDTLKGFETNIVVLKVGVKAPPLYGFLYKGGFFTPCNILEEYKIDGLKIRLDVILFDYDCKTGKPCPDTASFPAEILSISKL